jgi:hypothetical protein
MNNLLYERVDNPFIGFSGESVRNTGNAAHGKYVLEKLAEGEARQAKPGAKLHNWDDVWNTIRERHAV